VRAIKARAIRNTVIGDAQENRREYRLAKRHYRTVATSLTQNPKPVKVRVRKPAAGVKLTKTAYSSMHIERPVRLIEKLRRTGPALGEWLIALGWGHLRITNLDKLGHQPKPVLRAIALAAVAYNHAD
jgi:hypothetical protein